MSAPIAIKRPESKILAFAGQIIASVFLIASPVLPVLALNAIHSILNQFFLDTAALAPGTAIRPMGMDLQLGIIWTASILAGGFCAVVAGIIGLILKRRWLLTFAVLAALFSAVPMFYSHWGENHIVELRKLYDEP